MEENNKQTVPAVSESSTNTEKNSKRNMRYLFLGLLSFVLLGYFVVFRLGMLLQRYQSDLKIIDLQEKIRQQQAVIDIATKLQLLRAQTTPTLSVVPTSSMLCQKTYHSSGGHFSICVPNDWIVSQYGNAAEDSNTINMEITPANEPGIPSESM